MSSICEPVKECSDVVPTTETTSSDRVEGEKCVTLGKTELLYIETEEEEGKLSAANSLVEIPLAQSDSEEELDVPEDETADHLSPLIMDNHTVVEYHECFQPEEPKLTTKDSFSSIDSDLSLSYDQQNSSSAQQSDFQTSSDDNAKDSGCELNPTKTAKLQEDDECNGPIQIPDDDFSEKIVEQVEFYFSNESILKDAFLLKHVRRNKEGFVSLKLVSSFKRVRQLVKDWRVVGYAIKKKSTKIEVNDLGTKIRRIEPLPSYDETMPSRTVVATDLPLEKITIEKVFELFSKCGEIALVRIMRVGGPIPADVRQFINKYPELLQKECALVEFVESQSARNALQYQGMTVLEMIAPKKKTGKKANVTKLIETHHQFVESGADLERSRGGAPIENFAPRFQFRRTNSAHYAKPEQVYYVPPQRKLSFNTASHTNANSHLTHVNNQMNLVGSAVNHMTSAHTISQENYDPNYRRMSSTSIGSANDLIQRKLSNCSDGYSSDRRGSNQSVEYSRRPVTECSCNCGRRPSQNDLMFRRVSQCSQGADPMRKISASSYERRPSIGNETNWRQSEIIPERKYGNVHHYQQFQQPQSPVHYHHIQHQLPYQQTHIIPDSSPVRKYSNNGFDPLRKLSTSDNAEFINGRRISTDSGYDRKYSFSSDCGSARSRSGSFICTHNPVEQIVRTPVGPASDGSKGFATRTRKIGQILPPI